MMMELGPPPSSPPSPWPWAVLDAMCIKSLDHCLDKHSGGMANGCHFGHRYLFFASVGEIFSSFRATNLGAGAPFVGHAIHMRG